MGHNQEQVDELIARLASIPTRIAHGVARRNLEQLQAAPAPNTWSAQDILAHLRAADDIVTSRIYMVLVRDNPPLTAYDERRWAEVSRYHSIDFATSLSLFALRRAEVVMVLQNTNDEEWRRVGTHEVRGQVSLFEIVQGLVEHEEEHCCQLEAILGPCS